MGAGHYSRPMDERLLPHAKEPTLQTFNMVELKRSQVQLSHKNMKARRSGHSWFILALNLPANCKLWCVCICITMNLGVSSIHSSTMPRERGKPRRGSTWHTHATYRQRRQHMDRAFSLANSIIRQRARVTCLALHATEIESAMENRAQTPPALDNWQPINTKRVEIPAIEPETQDGSSLRENLEEDLPTEEDDITNALKPQATDTKRGRLCEDFPTCYVEEVSYEDEVLKRTCAVMVHHRDDFKDGNVF